MIWPAPEKATVTIFAGALDLPVRPPREESLPTLPPAQSAPPETATQVRPGVVRIGRLDLEVTTEGRFDFSLHNDDPLTAVADMARTQTLSRGAWQVRIATRMRWSCTRDSFVLHAALQAWEGETEICKREWDRTLPRDLV
jgi:hypothetical protein